MLVVVVSPTFIRGALVMAILLILELARVRDIPLLIQIFPIAVVGVVCRMARLARLGRSVLGVIVAIMFVVARLVAPPASLKAQTVWGKSQIVAPGFPASRRGGSASAPLAQILPLIVRARQCKMVAGMIVQPYLARKYAILGLQRILAIQEILSTLLLGYGQSQ